MGRLSEGIKNIAAVLALNGFIVDVVDALVLVDVVDVLVDVVDVLVDVVVLAT
jgi:hypothetical protein